MGQKKRSAGQGLKLLLIRDFLYNEATKEHPKNANDIIDYLKEYRITASTKTIYTDIQRLKYDLEIPIVYNAKRWGYYIEDRPFSSAELRLIIDCIRNAEFLTKDDAATLTEKIKGLASAPDRDLLAHQLEEEYRKSQTEASVIENIGLLMKAIDAGRMVSFHRYRYVAEHTKHTALEDEVFIVSPVKLIRKSNQYILEFAKDFENGGCIFDKIQVSMIDNVKILHTPSTHTKKENRTRQHSLEDALDVFYGKKRAITILFYNRASDQILSKLPEDAILVKVNSVLSKTTLLERVSPQFFSLLDSFGNYAKILEPKDVVDKYMQWQKQKLYDYARLYKVNLDDIPVTDDEPGGLGVK